MKILRITIILAGVVILGASLMFYFYINFKGKEIVNEWLQGAFERDAHVGQVRGTILYGLKISDVDVPGKFQARDISVGLGLPQFGKRKVVLRDVSVDSLRVEVTQENAAKGVAQTIPDMGSRPEDITMSNLPEQDFSLLIEHLEIKNSRLVVTDIMAGETRKILVDPFSLTAQNVAFPMQPQGVDFNASAVVKGDIPFSGCDVRAEGWVDFLGKNMRANVQLIEANGTVGLAAALNSISNQMQVKGFLKVAGIRENAQAPLGENTNLKDFVLEAVRDAGIEATIGFDFETRMDNFMIEPMQIEGVLAFHEDRASESLKEELRRIGEKFENFGKKYYSLEGKAPVSKEVLDEK